MLCACMRVGEAAPVLTVSLSAGVRSPVRVDGRRGCGCGCATVER